MLRDVMHRCPAVQENRLALLHQITAYPADRSLGLDPQHFVLRERPGRQLFGSEPAIAGGDAAEHFPDRSSCMQPHHVAPDGGRRHIEDGGQVLDRRELAAFEVIENQPVPFALSHRSCPHERLQSCS